MALTDYVIPIAEIERLNKEKSTLTQKVKIFTFSYFENNIEPQTLFGIGNIVKNDNFSIQNLEISVYSRYLRVSFDLPDNEIFNLKSFQNIYIYYRIEGRIFRKEIANNFSETHYDILLTDLPIMPGDCVDILIAFATNNDFYWDQGYLWDDWNYFDYSRDIFYQFDDNFVWDNEQYWDTYISGKIYGSENLVSGKVDLSYDDKNTFELTYVRGQSDKFNELVNSDFTLNRLSAYIDNDEIYIRLDDTIEVDEYILLLSNNTSLNTTSNVIKIAEVIKDNYTYLNSMSIIVVPVINGEKYYSKSNTLTIYLKPITDYVEEALKRIVPENLYDTDNLYKEIARLQLEVDQDIERDLFFQEYEFQPYKHIPNLPNVRDLFDFNRPDTFKTVEYKKGTVFDLSYIQKLTNIEVDAKTHQSDPLVPNCHLGVYFNLDLNNFNYDYTLGNVAYVAFKILDSRLHICIGNDWITFNAKRVDYFTLKVDDYYEVSVEHYPTRVDKIFNEYPVRFWDNDLIFDDDHSLWLACYDDNQESPDNATFKTGFISEKNQPSDSDVFIHNIYEEIEFSIEISYTPRWDDDNLSWDTGYGAYNAPFIFDQEEITYEVTRQYNTCD